MIAYVDSDQRLHLASTGGGESRRIEGPGARHTWPVWSPGGDAVLFSSASAGGNGRGLLGLYLHRLESATTEQVYANEPGSDAIAGRTPHYALWSPDGERLAFLARSSQGGMGLYASTVGADRPVRRLVQGTPLFLSWSPDSRFLLAHCVADHYLVDFQADGRVARVAGSSRYYMTPSWSPRSKRLALIRQRQAERQVLTTGDLGGGDIREVAEFDGQGAFAWSPGGDVLGLVHDLHGQTRFYRGLRLVAADGSGTQKVTDDLVLCFYWSPSGRQIAYITLAEGSESAVRWGVRDVEGGSTAYLAEFRPTEEQLTAFMFFDQYAQSHNPWSPDGDRLLFSGVLGSPVDGGALPRGDEANVLSVTTHSADVPTPIAKGVFACWSPGVSGLSPPPSGED